LEVEARAAPEFYFATRGGTLSARDSIFDTHEEIIYVVYRDLLSKGSPRALRLKCRVYERGEIIFFHNSITYLKSEEITDYVKGISISQKRVCTSRQVLLA